MKKSTVVLFVLVAFCLSISPEDMARAADTLEPYEIGATDLDFYLSVEDLGLDRKDIGISGEAMAGYGLTKRISAYLGLALGADGYLANGSADICLGTYGTLISTDYFDFDLILDFGLGGLNDFVITPGLELNFDLDPEMRTWGMWAGVGFGIYSIASEEFGALGETIAINRRVALDLPFTMGTYYTMAKRHQLLLTFTSVASDLANDPALGRSALALGYNVVLVDTLELITEVSVTLRDSPDGDWGFYGVGAVLGFVATIP
jgi:hypothetical protein